MDNYEEKKKELRNKTFSPNEQQDERMYLEALEQLAIAEGKRLGKEEQSKEPNDIYNFTQLDINDVIVIAEKKGIKQGKQEERGELLKYATTQYSNNKMSVETLHHIKKYLLSALNEQDKEWE